MPATGLKTVVTGNVYHGVASPLLFKLIFWRCLGIKAKSFWSFVLEFGPTFAWYSAAKEFVVVFDAFYILMMRQMFSI